MSIGDAWAVVNESGTQVASVSQAGNVVVAGTVTSAGAVLSAALDLDVALTATGDAANIAATMSHATQSAEGLDVSIAQITNARTAGALVAFKGTVTSLTGTTAGVDHVVFDANVVAGDADSDHIALRVGAGFSSVLDCTAAATGESDVQVADNLASAFEILQGTASYLRVTTTNAGEALTTARGVPSGTELKIGGVAYASTAASTAITGTTETETIFDTNYTFPANSLRAGTVVRVRAQGVHTATTGSETHTIALKIGSSTLLFKAAINPADNDIFVLECLITIRTAGAGGTLVAIGSAAVGASDAAAPVWQVTGSTAIDTTATQQVGVYIDRQASATDSDSARLDFLVVEVVG